MGGDGSGSKVGKELAGVMASSSVAVEFDPQRGASGNCEDVIEDLQRDLPEGPS